jgi:hypothetical protein
MNPKRLLSLSVAVLLGLSQRAIADDLNLVTNGTFSQGFSGWTATLDPSDPSNYESVINNPGNNHAPGATYAQLGPTQEGWLSQTIMGLTSGMKYAFQFVVAKDGQGGGFNLFQAYLNGSQYFDWGTRNGNPADDEYHTYSPYITNSSYHLPFFTSTSTSVTVAFAFQSDYDFFDLTNISLTRANPEPSSLAIAAVSGLLGAGYLWRRRRRV